MRKKLMTLLCAAALAGFAGCSGNQNNQSVEPGTTASAEQHNDAKFNSDAEKDAQFVVDAANMNLLEMKLSEIAEAHSTHPEVKEMAKMMSSFHAKSNDQLVAIAKNKNITVPTMADSSKASFSMLANKSGAEFDKAFFKELVDMHKETIERFQKASTDCQDSDLRNYASTQLPSLRTHLDKAMDNQKLAENW